MQYIYMRHTRIYIYIDICILHIDMYNKIEKNRKRVVYIKYVCLEYLLQVGKADELTQQGP